MKWNENYKIRFQDTDKNETASISTLFKLIQETAMRQMKAQSPSYEELVMQDKAFVLSAIRIELYSQVYAYDDVVASTWACPSRGFNFNRCYDIKKGDELICEASSVWALVSLSEKKLFTVNDIDLSSFCMDEQLTFDRGIRVRIPGAIPLNLIGEYTAKYSDVDLNGHVNNTNYPRILCDFIPNIENIRIRSMGIYFANDLKMGETVKIYMAKIGEKYFFRTVRNDDLKTNIEAEIIIELN
jgi:acyl-ACP thioesterase